MITVVTFNPSIDTLYKLESFEIGKVQRAGDVKKSAGGKGINVARVLNQLGHSPMCMGFVGGYNGLYIKDEIKKIGLRDEFIKIDGETRVCLNIIDKNKVSTEILESGPIVEENDMIKFERHLENILEETKILVASGSLPKGLPIDYYGLLGEICRIKNIKFILDTSGKYLESAINSHIYMIKPNIDELEALCKCNINNKEDAIKEAYKLLRYNIENICISMGKDGMILVNKDSIYEVKIPSIKIENTVGSGDSSIAGFAYGLLNDYSLKDCLRLSNACGMSNAMNIKTGFIDVNEVEKLFKEIEVLEYSKI